jgi:hypothetical protein
MARPRRLVVPLEVVAGIKTWRHACRLAWKLRQTRISQRTFAELTGCYPSHVSDYFSRLDHRRELPARLVGISCAVLGNAVLAQYIAQEGNLTVLEELQALRRAA